MPEATQSAVIIRIASAETAVSKHRLRFDVAASEGVPAHVTVLFPFVPPTEVDDQVIARLAAVFAAASPFDCTFDRCAWFGDDVLWLAPDRDQEFRYLTEQVVERFPGYLPYGGVHDDVVPHLTVGESEGARLTTSRQPSPTSARSCPSPPASTTHCSWRVPTSQTPGEPWPDCHWATLAMWRLPPEKQPHISDEVRLTAAFDPVLAAPARGSGR